MDNETTPIGVKRYCAGPQPDGEASRCGQGCACCCTGPVGPRGPRGPAGSPGMPGFADFFAVMPPDNAATVAPGADVEFPQDGPAGGGIVRADAGSFILPEAGVYLVLYQASVTGPAQLVLTLNGAELRGTVTGRDTGTAQLVGMAAVEADAGATLSVRNPASNPTALALTPVAGGTEPVSAHLVIVRVR